MQQRGERRPLLMIFDSREGYYLELTTRSYLLIGICLYLTQMGIVAPWSEPDTIHWPIQGWKGAPFNPFCQSCLGQELQSFVRVDPCRQQARRLASGASAWLLHHTHSTSLAVDRCRYVCVSHSLLPTEPKRQARRVPEQDETAPRSHTTLIAFTASHK
jgi:hypothetical protein